MSWGSHSAQASWLILQIALASYSLTVPLSQQLKLAAYISLPACLCLCFPATSHLPPALLAAQTVQQHRQTGSHSLPPAPTPLSCFHPWVFLYWTVRSRWWEEIALPDPLAREGMNAPSLSPRHKNNLFSNSITYGFKQSVLPQHKCKKGGWKARGNKRNQGYGRLLLKAKLPV